jgi:hypothetical protein
MDWTKILSKGWGYVVQTIIIIVSLFVIVSVTNGTGEQADKSIREDIKSVREQLDIVNEQNIATSKLTAELIRSNERVINGIDRLSEANKEARDIVTELGSDNIGHTRRIRAVQDQTFNSELSIDAIQVLIRNIERENDYN